MAAPSGFGGASARTTAYGYSLRGPPSPNQIWRTVSTVGGVEGGPMAPPHKFPLLLRRAVACQFTNNDIIVMFQFEESEDGVGVVSEKHYKLVPPEELTDEDIRLYQRHPSEQG